MGHHINDEGKFQSDKYPELAPDKMILSFKDPIAREALKLFAEKSLDSELSKDILERIKTIEE